MRLRLADGGALEQSEFSRLAQGSGLMPRIDAARMLRAARVARRLGERGRQGAVLTALAGKSLTDGDFLDAAALQPGSDGRVSLVLSFTQSDVRTFTPVHAEALGSMAASGFGFALEDVTDLDMDFGALKAMGFEFVKLDAPVFLEGLPTRGRAHSRIRHLPLPVGVRPHPYRRPYRGRLAAGADPRLRRAAGQRHPVRGAQAGEAGDRVGTRIGRRLIARP